MTILIIILIILALGGGLGGPALGYGSYGVVPTGGVSLVVLLLVLFLLFGR